MEGACVDLTFSLTPTGLLKTIEFEAHALEDTLADIGARDDAWLGLDAYDRPIAEVKATLYDVLSRLFGKRALDRGTAEVDDALSASLETRRRRQFEDSWSSVVFRVELS
ncbi:hypothetical protein KV097_05390 [Mumia sp. zg.B17]|uniref:hypothetical protein n=1 Tax=Mumia sp. zg.B17 TaxID=2855446 RepID=UPI001C6F0BE4|nr:hypothetical protein [Mumia sp. zg.B17]MBW9205372.1 hypothetical protein [Mumia sp. zg.B17]